MNEFKHNKSREAIEPFRGYVYQVYQSLYAWMRLGVDEALYLERAEDFDVHANETVIPTQIKNTTGNVTLRTKGCVDALNNYWKFRADNPDVKVKFRYLTTSLPGKEQGSKFPGPSKGLEYWTQAALNNSISIAPLRQFLQLLELSDELSTFLASASDDEVRNQLVRPICWDTGAKDIQAIETEIVNRLILHGERFGTGPHHSSSALADLILHVAKTIINTEKRKLTRIGFLKRFEKATSELVPRQSSVFLKAKEQQNILIARSAGATLVEGDGFAPIQTFINPIPKVQGAATRDSLVDDLVISVKKHRAIFLSGSTGLGKTHLASLISERIEGEWLWANFRDSSPSEIKHKLHSIYCALDNAPSSTGLILDDIDFKKTRQFENEIICLLFSATQAGREVIVTGYTPPPKQLLRKIWLEDDAVWPIPYLQPDDISLMLKNYGLNKQENSEAYTALIQSTTLGHPQLVHARVHNYASNGWPKIDDVSFTHFQDIEEVREEIRNRLVWEVPTDTAKGLLYRISLLNCQFPRELAIEIGQLDPSITLPGQDFDSLIGPWVEQVGDDEFRISPIITSTGSSIFSENELRRTHEHIAISLIKLGSGQIAHVNSILFHGLRARSEQALASFIRIVIIPNLDAIEVIAEYNGWFTTIGLKKGQHIFEENIHLDVFLRQLQFRLAAALGKSNLALQIFLRWIEAIELADYSTPDAASNFLGPDEDMSAEEIKGSTYGLAYITLLSQLELKIDPIISLNALSQLIDLEENNRVIGEAFEKLPVIPQEINFEGTAIEGYFAMSLARLKGAEDVIELLDGLDKLPANKRMALISNPGREELDIFDTIATAAWFPDVSNNCFNGETSVAALKKAMDMGRKWSVDALIKSACIALSVVYDEYLDDPQQAKAILKNTPSQYKDSGQISYQRGKIDYTRGNHSEALKTMLHALSQNGLKKTERVFALRHAAISAAKCEDWSQARELFLRAAKAAKKTLSFKVQGVGLITEAAFASWKLGDPHQLMTLLKEAVIQLETIPIDDDLSNRHIHAAVGHFMGWLSLSIPEKYHEMPEPFPGMFSTSNPHEELKTHQVPDMPMVWGLLGTLDQQLKTNLNISAEAEERFKDNVPMLIRATNTMVPFEQEWDSSHTPDAVNLIIRMFKGFNTLREARAKDINTSQPGPLLDLPDDYWATTQNVFDFIAFLLVVCIKATASFPYQPIPVATWREDIEKLGINNDDINSFIARLNGEEVGSQTILEVVTGTAMHKLRETTVSPYETALYQFWILSVVRYEHFNAICGHELAHIVSSTWIDIADNQQFALQSPRLYCPMILEACQDDELSKCQKVASILNVAFDAVGANVHSDVRELLRMIQNSEPEN